MSENIVSSLKNREINIRFDPENFFNINYFNHSMINKMRVEHKINHQLVSWDDNILCGSWNSSGYLLGCGKALKGVQIFKPFQNFKVDTIEVQNNHYLTDALFMPKHENLLAVASRSKSSFMWSSLNGLEKDEYVKVWDVEAKAVTRSYTVRGLVKKVATSEALPNLIWFNIDQSTHKMAEADTRTSQYKSMWLNEVKNQAGFSHSRSFAVNPFDEVTIAVSEKNQLMFYDRRMMTSSVVNYPTGTVDTSSLEGDSSYIAHLKYHRSGEKLLLTKSSRFNISQYVVPSLDPSVENIQQFKFRDQIIVGTVTKNPSFLGEHHVLFDTFFRNYSVVFNLDNMSYVGKTKLFGQTNFLSNISSLPHPFYCLIASINHDTINFITPTSSNQT